MLAHRFARLRVGQSITGHHVDDLQPGRRVLVTPAGARIQSKPGPRHRLETTGQYQIDLSCLDLRGCGHDRSHPRRAHHVDGESVNVFGDAGEKRRLAGYQLAVSSSQDVAHDHEIELVAVDPRSFDRGLHHRGRQLGRGQILEGTTKAADGRADCGNDIDHSGGSY